MKKRDLLIVGLMALTASVAHANAKDAPAACSASACHAEQTFAQKLSKDKAEVFAKMNALQKAAVLAAKDLTPDAAVEKVAKELVAQVTPEVKVDKK